MNRLPSVGHSCTQCNEAETFYRRRKSLLQQKHPNLANSPGKPIRPNHAPTTPRLVCYQFGAAKLIKTEITDADELRHYLGHGSGGNVLGGQPLRRLFILEGFNDMYETIISARLKIHPKFWHRHKRAMLWESTKHSAGNVPLLPSTHESYEIFLLNYCQLMHLGIKDQTFNLRCAENERYIACARYDGKFDGIGSVYRKVSFWATLDIPNGWNGLLLIDEPFKSAITGTSTSWQTVKPLSFPVPFQGGYADFLPLCEMDKDDDDDHGPPRTSLFEDLQYYFDVHGHKLDTTANPRSATVFIEKIVASEYMLLIQYYQALLYRLHWYLVRVDAVADLQHQWITQSWSGLVAAQRRLQDHQSSVQDILLCLYAEPQTQSSVPALPLQGWKNIKKDFSSIHEKLSELLVKAESLVSAFNALSSATAAQQSLNEASTVRFLTLIGMTFLPLSLTAALFSMTEEYTPGGPKFWLYFAVGVPLTLLVYLLAALRTGSAPTQNRLSFKEDQINNIGIDITEDKPKRRWLYPLRNNLYKPSNTPGLASGTEFRLFNP